MITREKDAAAEVTAKQEGKTTTDHEKTSTKKASISSTSAAAESSSWSRLKDPRIVRVSRAFGGKDRHSKVCTVRGLRDRRVRLSVPTAIQLYDLQDRLGLNQPSKAVDWLLNATKHEIDKLPPLQIPPGNFYNHSFQPFLTTSSHHLGVEVGGAHPLTKRDHDHHPNEAPSGSKTWGSETILRPKSEDLVTRKDSSENRETWIRSSDQEGILSPNNFFSRLGHPSSSNLLPPYNSSIRWDPSNLSLSQSRSLSALDTSQPENFQNFGVVPLLTQSYFPSHNVVAATSDDYAPRQINFQMLNSSSEDPLSQHAGRHFNLLSTTTKLTQNHCDSKQDDDSGFRPR